MDLEDWDEVVKVTVWYLEDNHQCYKHDCELHSPAYRDRGGRYIIGRREKWPGKVRRGKVLVEKVGRREIYPPVPPTRGRGDSLKGLSRILLF